MPQFDLEKILTAAKQIGDNIQKENARLTEENEKLKAQVKSLSEDNELLRLEMEDVNAAKNALREANETFGNNLNQLMAQLNQTIEENHKNFIAQVNQLMRDEFQKFLSEYMDKLRGTSETGVAKVEQVEDNPAVIVEETENLPVEQPPKRQKMMYADFYAIENVAVEEEEVSHRIDYKSRIKPPEHK